MKDDDFFQTSVKQGEAWGFYYYIGRVRRWDGLVVLLRIPVRYVHSRLTPPNIMVYPDQIRDPVGSRGRVVFKGYVHGQSLVGRWRDTATDMHALGYEGGFVFCRQD